MMPWGLRCIVFLTFFLSIVQADERILSFHSDIHVNMDRSIDVIETIRVQAEGREIKRGIYRDFPTIYRDRYGNSTKVGFEIVSIKRDGEYEMYHQENRSNGIRTYIGRSSVYLPNGEYTYTIHYRTTWQLGFYEDFDELYWNVTGNGWIFPIDKASATLHLPRKVPDNALQIAVYSGGMGMQGKDYTYHITEDGSVYFETTKPLRVFEGITIAVGWPKGIVPEPTAADLRARFYQDNRVGINAMGIVMLMLLYYYLAWRAVGRDPQKGIIIPLYTPPKGYSAAAMNYIKNMGYSDASFSAGILSLAVKGFLRIKQKGSEYTLIKVEPTPKVPLAAGEKVLLRGLFKSLEKLHIGHKTTSSTERSILVDAQTSHRQSLEKYYAQEYFKINGLWTFVGGLFTAFLVVYLNTQGASTLGVISVGVAFLLNVSFYFWLKAPTKHGRKILDKIDGFTDYLQIAEKDEMNLRHPPEKTPELFESYLPFAIALGVEQAWAQKFNSMFNGLRREGIAYSPDWYDGHSFSVNNVHQFNSDFSRSISSASTPPGSSSSGGSSGGGFSGGGGGGGGGGGW